MKHYNAFISYNHNPRDISIASRLQSQLENYRIPKDIKTSTGITKIERVFLDKGELEVAGDLNEVICSVLEDTDHLIVICSPESKKSIWVKREIEYFLRNHSIDDILTVITDGEPFDVLPEVLFHKAGDIEHADPETEGEEELLREPLSCDYRLPPRVARNVELPRLVAALIGCKYDDLVQRQRHYRARRRNIILSTAAVILLSAVTYLIWSNNQIKTNLETSLRQQSMNLSMQSEEALSMGDRISALRYAIDALPSEEAERPVVPEAVLALSKAMNIYKASSTYAQNAVRRYHSYGNRHIRLNGCSVGDRSFIAELYSSGRFALWDAVTGRELMPDYSSGLAEESTRVQNLAFTNEGNLVLITSKSVRVVDPRKESEIKNIPIDGEYFKVYDYNEFKTMCDDLVIEDNTLWIPVATVTDHENYDELTVRRNSLAVVDAIGSFARDSNEGDELVLDSRRRMASDVSYRIMSIDLGTGKVNAEASIPRRPSIMRISLNGKYLACCYTDFYDSTREGSDDRIEIMDADDLSVSGSIKREFISDFCFDMFDRIILCGFDKKPEKGDSSAYGMVDYTGKGTRALFSFSTDRNLVLRCFDPESCDELWGREEKINARGIPRIGYATEKSVLGNAIFCIVSNALLITDKDGKDIGFLHDLSGINKVGCTANSMVTILDDGAMTSWTYDKDHGFSAITGHNALLGPVIDYAETRDDMFILSIDSKSDAYKEILTQYQDNGLDTRLEPYIYAGASDPEDGMELTAAEYYKDSFVEIRRGPTGNGSSPSDEVSEIIVRDIDSGKILMTHDVVVKTKREGSAEGSYTNFLYSGIDRNRGKVYFLDNREYQELTLLSVDLENGNEEKIPLRKKRTEGSGTDQMIPDIFDILRPIDTYSAYNGSIGIFSLDSKHINYAALEAIYKEDINEFVFRLVVLEADPETGGITVRGISDEMDSFDNALYSNVRLNAACERVLVHEDSRFKYYDFSGRELWSSDELTYDPVGFTIADDGNVIAMENTNSEAVLHVFSPDKGKETTTSLGSVIVLTHEQMTCEDLSDEERLITAGDDAYLVDSKTWELRTVISDNYIACSPEAKQFMLGDADSRATGHVPYRTLNDMIAEAKEILDE